MADGGRWMTDRQIVESYLHAENRRSQPRVIAELNGMERADVIDILAAHGIRIRPQKMASAFRIAHRWTAEDDRLMLAMREEGKTYGEIAQILGRTYGAVSARMRVKREEEER